MKILRITENQYRKLLNRNLTEEIIYQKIEDKLDLSPVVDKFLRLLNDTLLYKRDKNLYVKDIKDGIVTIDEKNYDDEDTNLIGSFIDYWVTKEGGKKGSGLSWESEVDYDYEDLEDLSKKKKCWCTNNEDNTEIEYFCYEGEPKECKPTEQLVTIPTGEFGLDTLTNPQKMILSIISKAESVDDDYNSSYPNTIINGLINLTIREIIEKTGAKGRYQFIPKYLKGFATKSGLSLDDIFSPKNQDKMALSLFEDVIGDCLKLENRLVTTWAGLPVLYGRQGNEKYVNRGDSYYSGVGNNKSTVSVEDFEKVIKSCGCDMTNLNEKINGATKKNNLINILVIGDSQSVGGNSYHNKLDKNKYKIKNKSVTGRNTGKMLSELKKNNLDDYDVVIIMGGGNDAYREVTDTTAQNNLQSMYEYVKNNSNAKLIVISNPTKKYYKGNNKYPSNDLIAKYVMDNNLPDFKINANSLGEGYFKNDKIHLNEQGQNWIKGELEKILVRI